MAATTHCILTQLVLMFSQLCTVTALRVLKSYIRCAVGLGCVPGRHSKAADLKLRRTHLTGLLID